MHTDQIDDEILALKERAQVLETQMRDVLPRLAAVEAALTVHTDALAKLAGRIAALENARPTPPPAEEPQPAPPPTPAPAAPRDLWQMIDETFARAGWMMQGDQPEKWLAHFQKMRDAGATDDEIAKEIETIMHRDAAGGAFLPRERPILSGRGQLP